MAGGGGGSETTLEYTPTWVVALVCSVIVAISLLVERVLHRFGKYLNKKTQIYLFSALQRIKEELMLVGFISLLLAAFQDVNLRICIPKSWNNHWLPCKKPDHDQVNGSTTHLLHHRRLLAGTSATASFCEQKGKAPLLSITALHHLHIFIFVLAITHVVFCALTIVFGSLKIQQWKPWEDSILEEENSNMGEDKTKVTHIEHDPFIKSRIPGIQKCSGLISWVHSFCKQFTGSLRQSEYKTLRRGFIKAHLGGNTKFNFHEYMMRCLKSDFKRVVGISWYLWVFVVIFLFINVYGWHAYFWISFIPLTLLLAVGTKLEHVITQLAQEVANRHVAVQGDIQIDPSDYHFWFNRPRFILTLIHIILFQNAFEIAVFFWIWIQYGFDSCIMGPVGFVIPRLVIGVFVQFLCSYSTLPLYAIVTQMGSSIKKDILSSYIQEGLLGWAEKVKKKKGVLRKAANSKESHPVKVDSIDESSNRDQISAMEKGTSASEIQLS